MIITILSIILRKSMKNCDCSKNPYFEPKLYFEEKYEKLCAAVVDCKNYLIYSHRHPDLFKHFNIKCLYERVYCNTNISLSKKIAAFFLHFPSPSPSLSLNVTRRHILQLHHVHGRLQRGHHHHGPQLPP